MHTATLPNHHPDTRNKVVVPPVVSKTVRQILHNPVNTTTEMSHGVRCDGIWDYVYIETENMVSDIFTKDLADTPYESHSVSVLGQDE